MNRTTGRRHQNQPAAAAVAAAEEQEQPRTNNKYPEPDEQQDTKDQEHAMQEYATRAIVEKGLNLPPAQRLGHNFYERPKSPDLEEAVECVYLLTFPSGKFYVGRSVNFHKRMIKHNSSGIRRDGGSIALNFAIKKYGWNNVRKEILEYCATSEDTDRKETELIALFNTLAPHGYNLIIGNGSNKKQNDFTKEKTSGSHVYNSAKDPRHANRFTDQYIFKHQTRRKIAGIKKQQAKMVWIYSIVDHPLCDFESFATLEAARIRLNELNVQLAEQQEQEIQYNTKIQRLIAQEPVILPYVERYVVDEHDENIVLVRHTPILGQAFVHA